MNIGTLRKYQVSGFSIIISLLIVLALSGSYVARPESTSQKTALQENTRREESRGLQTECGRLPQLCLPIEGYPTSVITLFVSDGILWDPSSPRHAVLYYDKKLRVNKLTIFIPAEDGLEAVFSIEQGSKTVGDWGDWREMQQFPSYYLPGVILWGNVEQSRETVKLICYVHGTFRVVFEGIGVTFLDLDGDWIPEIFSVPVSEYSPYFIDKKVSWLVHTWNGSEFVLATRFEDWNQRFSDEVINAVKQAKKKPEASP